MDNKIDRTPKQLTRKQKAFVDYLLDNPKASGVKAALAAYGSTDKPVTYGSAETIAYDNLRNPRILALLTDASTEAEGKVIALMRHSKREDIQMAAARDILDRVHGKATQRTEVTSSAVTVSIDLSGSTPTE